MLCILPLEKVIKEKEMKSPGTPEHQICTSAVYFCAQRRLALIRRFSGCSLGVSPQGGQANTGTKRDPSNQPGKTCFTLFFSVL